MDPTGLLILAIGAFSCLGAILNWDFYFNARKARFFVSMLGRNGARLFYLILGLGLMVLGGLLAAGVFENAN